MYKLIYNIIHNIILLYYLLLKLFIALYYHKLKVNIAGYVNELNYNIVKPISSASSRLRPHLLPFSCTTTNAPFGWLKFG